MALKLAIENMTNLPDGGPVSIAVSGRRGIDIGRDSHLDWTLPDPNRFISGKHCEIRYEAGSYVLHDVSSNGTFVNGAPNRMLEPRRLRNGDRLAIGHYVIAVSLDESGDDAKSEVGSNIGVRPTPADLWEADEAAPAPIDPRDLKPIPDRPTAPDFLDWAIDVFDPLGEAPKHDMKPRPDEDASWMPPPPVEKPPEEPAPIPNPRRPAWSDDVRGAPEPAPVAPPSLDPVSPLLPTAAREELDDPSDSKFVRRFAEAAGLSPEAIAKQDPEELAALLGGLMQIVAEDLKTLLNARLEAKRIARSSNQTTIQAADNNPLKFSPTARDALRLMFGPPTRSYLPAASALRQSFDDLKRHQIDTLSAMQGAVKMLVDDLDPDKIEESVEPDRGLSRLIASRKARLWDAYVARWRAKAHRHDDGLLGAFMFYFPQCYDRSDRS